MKYKISKKVSWQTIDDLLWIINEETQILYAINNKVSVNIWKKIYNGTDKSKIEKFLYELYGIEEIKEDLNVFINELLEKELIEIDE